MSALVQVVRFVSLMLVGLYAGGVFFTVIAPTVQRLPGDAYVRYWQALNTDYRRAMPKLIIPALVATVGSALLARTDGVVVVILFAVSASLLGGTVVMTLRGLDPLNRSADAWDPTGPPADWEAARSTWQQLHLVRTALAIAAFAALLLAVLLSDGPR